MLSPKIRYLKAIDPWALILTPAVYIKLHLPDPPEDEVAKAVKGASPIELKEIRGRISYLKECIAVAEKTLEHVG